MIDRTRGAARLQGRLAKPEAPRFPTSHGVVGGRRHCRCHRGASLEPSQVRKALSDFPLPGSGEHLRRVPAEGPCYLRLPLLQARPENRLSRLTQQMVRPRPRRAGCSGPAGWLLLRHPGCVYEHTQSARQRLHQDFLHHRISPTGALGMLSAVRGGAELWGIGHQPTVGIARRLTGKEGPRVTTLARALLLVPGRALLPEGQAEAIGACPGRAGAGGSPGRAMEGSPQSIAVL